MKKRRKRQWATKRCESAISDSQRQHRPFSFVPLEWVGVFGTHETRHYTREEPTGVAESRRIVDIAGPGRWTTVENHGMVVVACFGTSTCSRVPNENLLLCCCCCVVVGVWNHQGGRNSLPISLSLSNHGVLCGFVMMIIIMVAVAVVAVGARPVDKCRAIRPCILFILVVVVANFGFFGCGGCFGHGLFDGSRIL